jgi:Tol biopolymer transport system component
MPGFLLGACSIGPASAPTPDQPTSPTQPAQISQVSILEPAITTVPVLTLTPSLTLTPGLSPAQQATRLFENSSLATAEAEVTILADCGAPLERYYSPDQNWVAVECVNHGSLGIYNPKNPSKAWLLSYYEVFGLKHADGSFSGRLIPKHWSVDGKYLYFFPHEDDEAGCIWYPEGQGLLQLDLLTGKFSEILVPDENSIDYNFSFSNKDTYLGYFETGQEHPTLYLRNMLSGAIQKIFIGEQFTEAGFLVWSPDNRQVLFSARAGADCNNMTYYLVLINPRNYTQKIILEGKTARFLPFQWIEGNQVIITSVKADYSRDYYYLDLTTGAIRPYLQPAPSPEP